MSNSAQSRIEPTGAYVERSYSSCVDWFAVDHEMSKRHCVFGHLDRECEGVAVRGGDAELTEVRWLPRRVYSRLFVFPRAPRRSTCVGGPRYRGLYCDDETTMTDPTRTTVTAETIDLAGSWQLVSVGHWVDGELTDTRALFDDPVGFLHYLDGRVAVLMAERHRPAVNGRQDHLAERDAAVLFSTFIAYSGTYTRAGTTVVHHLDICLYANDVGTEYVRQIEVDGDRLVLVGPPRTSRDGTTHVNKLTWERYTTPA